MAPILKTIEDFGMGLEDFVKEVPSVKREALFAHRKCWKTLYTPQYKEML